INTNVSYIAVGDGIPDVPKRHLYINLKFGQPIYPTNPIFPLDLPAAAHRRFACRGTRLNFGFAYQIKLGLNLIILFYQKD
ncbi:MAG: hypothetical protein ACI4HN_03505, partial [Ruminococcus sp.]